MANDDKRVILVVDGSISAALTVARLLEQDAEVVDIDIGAWAQPVIINNIKYEDAEALQEILFTESDGRVKSTIKEK